MNNKIKSEKISLLLEFIKSFSFNFKEYIKYSN